VGGTLWQRLCLHPTVSELQHPTVSELQHPTVSELHSGCRGE
jgi:hypothetical protein